RGGHSPQPRLHEVLHGPPRALAVAAGHAPPARADPAAAECAVLDLPLRVLAAADGRPSVRGLGAEAGPVPRRRPARDRRPPRRDEATAPPHEPPAPRARRGGGVGEGAPGGRRLVGRYPAAVGLVDRD